MKTFGYTLRPYKSFNYVKFLLQLSLFLIVQIKSAQSQVITIDLGEENYFASFLNWLNQEIKTNLSQESVASVPNEFSFWETMPLSSFLWVTEDTCKECAFGNDRRYTCTENTCNAESEKLNDQDLGRGYIIGHKARDQLFINSRTSLSFPFLSVFTLDKVEEIKNKLYEADGGIGFGYSKSRNGSLVNQLYLEKKIERNMFSMVSYGYHQDIDTPRQLILGGYDQTIVGKEENIVYCKVISKDKWQIKLKEARFGREDFFSFTSRKVQFSMSYSGIGLPSEDFNLIKQFAFSINPTCKIVFEDFIFCQCTQEIIDKHPLIKLTFPGIKKTQSIYIPSQDYIINIVDNNSNYCFYTLYDHRFITYYSQDEWILGITFMKSAYTIFSYEQDSVGFVYLGQNYDDSTLYKSNSDFITSVAVLIFITLFCVGIYLYKRQQKKQQQQLDNKDSSPDIPLIQLNQMQ